MIAMSYAVAHHSCTELYFVQVSFGSAVPNILNFLAFKDISGALDIEMHLGCSETHFVSILGVLFKACAAVMYFLIFLL